MAWSGAGVRSAMALSSDLWRRVSPSCMKSAALSMLDPSPVGANMIAYPGSPKGGAMRIGISGGGASDCGVGGLLARAGQDVTLVDQWPEHVETMRSRG